MVPIGWRSPEPLHTKSVSIQTDPILRPPIDENTVHYVLRYGVEAAVEATRAWVATIRTSLSEEHLYRYQLVYSTIRAVTRHARILDRWFIRHGYPNLPVIAAQNSTAPGPDPSATGHE